MTPPVVSGLHFGYPLSILAVKEAYRPWLYSNFIQLFCPRNFPSESFLSIYFHAAYPFLICPLLDIQWIGKDLIGGDLEDFIIGCIERDYYVQVFADEYYIPQRNAFQKSHFMHEVLVTGFARKERLFQVLGYNQYGQFLQSYVPFGQLALSVRAVDSLSEAQGCFRADKIWLARYVEDETCELDLTSIREQLGDLLGSKDSSQRFRMVGPPEEVGAYRVSQDSVFGLEVYLAFRRYLEQLIEGQACFDPRHIYLLWEHKKIMAERLAYLEEEGYLPVEKGYARKYAEVAGAFGILRMMHLKFGQNGDRALGRRMVGRFNPLVEDETALLQAVLSDFSI
ncbi:MAG: hypothetical protein GKR89_36570 [Candidatus Latescibacteria bacterium]|nr:hypothetical protein [Candidatus Latescibacterota bacterium]